MTKFFKFKGTSKRIEYWSIMVIGSIIIFVVTLDLLELLTTGESRIHQTLGLAIVLGAIILTALWIQLATIVRRCRDSGISPWWSALVLIPYVGFVGLLVMGILPSKDSNNKDNMENIKQKFDELEESFIKFQFIILKLFEFTEKPKKYYRFKTDGNISSTEKPKKYYRFKTDGNISSEPLSEEQLYKLFNNGKIYSKTEIRCDDDLEWIEFYKVFPEKVLPYSDMINGNVDPWTKTRSNDPQIRTKYNESEVQLGFPDVFDFIRGIPHFIFLVIAVLSYLMSIIKWFIKEHNTFLGAFLELIWALIPVINIIYVIDWWLIFFRFIILFVFG